MNEEDVQWVVNDLGELGIKVSGQFFFLYKGTSLSYGPAPERENGQPMRYRPVFKREFGECCHPINRKDPSKDGGVFLTDSNQWKPIVETPVAPALVGRVVVNAHGLKAISFDDADWEKLPVGASIFTGGVQ